MISTAKLLPPSIPPPIPSLSSPLFLSHLPSKPNYASFPLPHSPPPFPNPTNLFFSPVHLTRHLLPVIPSQKSHKFGFQSVRKKCKGGNKLLEIDDDNDSDDDEVDNNKDEELELGLDGGDDNEEGLLVPFEEMKKWLEKKPCEFGEGKVYDTPIEDKLLEELQAQAETAAKDKNDIVKTNNEMKSNLLFKGQKEHNAPSTLSLM